MTSKYQRVSRTTASSRGELIGLRHRLRRLTPGPYELWRGYFLAMATSTLEPSHRPGALYWAPGEPSVGHIGLLHGLTSAATTWWAVGPRLAARGWEVTAVDLPGHGQGPKLRATPTSLVDLARETVPVLPDRLTVLAGHSLGAVVALSVAVEFPDLAAGVVLVEPPALGDADISLFADGVEAEGEAARADPVAARERARRDHPTWDDDEVERTVAARAASDTKAIAQAMRSGLNWDLAALVDAAPVPVLVVAAPQSDLPFFLGGTSALMAPERARLAELLPEERFLVVEGGHSLQRDQPEKISQLVLDFAEDLRLPDKR